MLPETPPVFEGVAGRAWSVPLVSARPHSTLAGYLLVSQRFHPAWSRWLFSVIHLRPVEGIPDARIRLPGATHEIMIASLDPSHYGDHRTLPPENGFHLLRPLDLEEQFIVPADQFAQRMLEIAVESCCNGSCSPDSDYRRSWCAAIQATAKRYREGGSARGLA